MTNRTIALVGNPNSGKTTFFNALTGANQHVGNWPGVTVEKKEGNFTHEGITYHVVDLPGIYSFGAYSEDEVVARDFLLNYDCDVIINVLDAGNLERNLYLTTQLIEMGKTIILALNMVDEAENRDIKIDVEKLSAELGGLKVVPTVAYKEQGIDAVIQAVADTFNNGSSPVILPDYNDSVQHHIGHVEAILAEEKLPFPVKWTAIKIVEGDNDIIDKVLASDIGEKTGDEIKNFLKYHSGDSFELDIVDSRYAFANRLAAVAVTRPENDVVTFTDKLDKFFTNKYLGIPIFALIMLVVFFLTFKVGEDLLGGFAESAVDWLGDVFEGFLEGAGAPLWLISFVVNGLVNGVGAVIEFVPLITVLYLLLGFLEDSGYMARAAYVWDDLMRKFGLQGKSFISMIIGFGCNVPGIMAARTMDNRKDRMVTMLINPFMSCGAKIPIYTIFIAAFFPKYAALVLFGLYGFGILVALILAKIFSSTIFKGDSSYFIMELPPYRIPTLKNVLRNMWENVWGFIKRAGSIILVVIILMWFLAYFPLNQTPYGEFSFLGRIGNFLTPIFKPAGFGHWQESVALFAGIPAKEAVVGTLGMLYAGEYMEEGLKLVNAIQAHFTPLTAISYMVMVLLYTPCVATLGIFGKETKSIRWPLFMAVFTFALAWLVSVIIFQFGSLLGFA